VAATIRAIRDAGRLALDPRRGLELRLQDHRAVDIVHIHRDRVSRSSTSGILRLPAALRRSAMSAVVRLPAIRGPARIRIMRTRTALGRNRTANWARRAASWLPVVGLFAIFAALRFDAADGVVTALLIATFLALVIDAIVFLLAYSRTT
jgi:hypothetical protein